jgi:benzoylformate decarboxylase
VLGAPVFAFLPYQPGGPAMPELIQVTDDPDEAARAPTALSVVADTASVVDELLANLPEGEPSSGSARPPAPPPPTPGPAEPIRPAFLMATLGELVADDAVIVEESPSNRSDFRRHVPIRRPGGFYATASGGLGFAMPAAVGIKLADRSRPVVCLVGDGSALYAPQAVWSAVQLRTPVAFVVVNNGRYAILESAAQFGGLRDLPSFELPGIDFVSLAASLGCEAARVEDPARLRDALTRALGSDGPFVLDVAIDPTTPPLLDEPASPGQEAR